MNTSVSTQTLSAIARSRLLFLIICSLLAGLLVVTATFITRRALAADTITMDPIPSFVSPGDVLTLRGKERFNHGQLNGLSFFIGGERVTPNVPNVNTVELTVPELPSGTYPVQIIKHYFENGRDIVLFSQDIRIGGERVLSTVTGEISPGGGRLQLPGVARVELGEDVTRAPVTVTIEDVSAPSETRFFRDYLRSENVPQIATSSLVRVLTNQRINDYMGVRIRVPAEIIAALTPGLEPELYGEIPSLNADEDMGEFRPLNAEFNSETGELSAPFAGTYFNEASTSFANAGNALQVAPFTGRIRVSVRNFGARRVPLEATTSFPSAPTFEAGARETLNLSAQLDIKIPMALRNPTSYGSEHSPTITSPFAANHGGLDIRSRDGDPVYAAADGTVANIFNNVLPGSPRCNPNVRRGGGWSIAINHADGTRTSYSHLIEGSELVAIGDTVTSGQQIAQADHTGGTCPEGPAGAHLHFGYRIDGVTTNPLPYIQANPEDFRQQWLSQLSVVAVVDGMPIRSTRRQVTNEEFDYAAPLDLSPLNLQPNQTYPVSLRLTTQDGQSVDFYSGRMRIKPTALRIVLTWNSNDTDVDLHVRDSNGNHAWYGNLTGIPGAFLDHDDVDGFGPEVFTMETLAPNTAYLVYIHYYSDHGNGPTTARTIVYLDNVEVTNTTTALTDDQTVTIGNFPPTGVAHGILGTELNTSTRENLKNPLPTSLTYSSSGDNELNWSSQRSPPKVKVVLEPRTYPLR